MRNTLRPARPTLLANGAPLSSYLSARTWFGRNGTAVQRTFDPCPFVTIRLATKPHFFLISTQVRLLLNGAPFSLSPICKADKQTGACLLNDFVKGTEQIRSIKWGDATWNATCGKSGA